MMMHVARTSLGNKLALYVCSVQRGLALPANFS